MKCISRQPKCGFGDGTDPVADPLKQFGAILAGFGSIFGALSGLGLLKDIIAFLGMSGASTFTAAIAVAQLLLLIGMYAFNRCLEGDGLPQCIAGCVSNIQESFSEAGEYIFPFTAMHNRVDVTVKSFFWDAVELNNAYVYCSSDPYPQMSEIMHCYYYTKRVCNAAVGALYGAAVGGAVGIIIAAAVGTAIGGCATVILCLLALILAALIAVAAALVGAFVGGNIVAAATGDQPPADGSGTTIATGMLVTLHGNMRQLEEDNKANCLWWVHNSQIHGTITGGTHEPFSYCDIDEQFTMDGCGRATPTPAPSPAPSGGEPPPPPK